MSESTNNQRENIFPFPMARRGFRTLSRVRQREISLQLRSKREKETQPQNNSISLPESMQPKKESESLRVRLKKLLSRLKILPGAIILSVSIKIAKMILKWRNRPISILIYPNPLLKRISEPVNFENTSKEERTEIIRKMGIALVNQTWGEKQGIAAPQIGINLRVIVVRGNVMFNPEWTPTKAPEELMIEACYSVPGKMFQVYRAKYGWAKWTNIYGKPFEDKLSGIPAVVFQHELNHLDGICCNEIGEEIKK